MISITPIQNQANETGVAGAFADTRRLVGTELDPPVDGTGSIDPTLSLRTSE